MHIQDCFTGQRVMYKENGKLAAIRRIHGDTGELELAFDNGSTGKAHARLVEPATSPAPDGADSGPIRQCPQCATRMPVTLTVCPSCGFEYGRKRAKPPRNLMKVMVILMVLVAIAGAVWKYLLT